MIYPPAVKELSHKGIKIIKLFEELYLNFLNQTSWFVLFLLSQNFGKCIGGKSHPKDPVEDPAGNLG